MKSGMFSVFLLAGVAVAASLVGQTHAQIGTCSPLNPTVPPVENLNRTRLEGKKWYIQQKFYTRHEDVNEPSVNCYMYYVDRYDGATFKLNETYTYFATGEFRHMEYDGTTVGDDDAIWGVSRYQRPPIGTNGHVTVFAFTDYETYGIMHWCPYTDFADWEHVLLFTGSPNPDEELLQELRNKVEKLGFTTEFGIQYEHPADCRYE